MAKQIGLGTVLKCSTAGTTTFGVTLAQIRSISGPSASADDIDVSTLDGGLFKQFHKGLVDGGEVGLDLVYDCTSHAKISSLLGTTTAAKWKVILPVTTQTEEFDGYLKGLDRVIPVDGAMTATATIKVNGNPGYTT